MGPNAVLYDCEIIRCIPPAISPDLEYCGGWNDHANMGISVVALYDFRDGRYHIYLSDNLEAFAERVASADVVIGFNSLAFDDKLCAAHGIPVRTTYDLLCEVRAASGQPREYVYGRTRPGYSLERLAWANLGTGKSGSGALAPELWQQGQVGKVIDYCLGDVALTKRLFDRRHELVDPTGRGMLMLREPDGWI